MISAREARKKLESEEALANKWLANIEKLIIAEANQGKNTVFVSLPNYYSDTYNNVIRKLQELNYKLRITDSKTYVTIEW